MNGTHYESKVQIVRAPAAVGTTAAGYNGKIIDRQGFEQVEFAVAFGTRTGITSTMPVTVLEGTATDALTSAADADLLGTESGVSLAAATGFTSGVNKNVAKRIGYIGTKRYVTLNHKATVTAATIVGSVAILSGARKDPQS